MGRGVSCGAVACQVKADTHLIEKRLQKIRKNSKRVEVSIFSVLLPTPCLYGDGLEGGWCVSG